MKKSAAGEDGSPATKIFLFASLLWIFACLLAGCVINANTVRNTRDQAKLAEIVMESSDETIRALATRKITDQAVLGKIATRDDSAEVRRCAVANLTDQAVLAKVAIADQDGKVRGAALWKITSQELLAKVVRETANDGTRAVALMKITDPKEIARFATEDKSDQVRSAAAAALDDQAILAGIARQDRSAGVRISALAKLRDQAPLARIAIEDPAGEVRAAAVARLNDLTLLARIAEGDKDGTVRDLAADRLKEQKSQAEIAARDSDRRARREAIATVVDKATLVELLKNEHDELVCEAAYDRLNELNEYKLLRDYRFNKGKVGKRLAAPLPQDFAAAELSATLFAAVRAGDLATCKQLILAGADINSRDGFGNTPLMAAIKSRHEEVALELVRSKADLSLANKRKENAVFLAAYNGKICQALLSNGARIAEGTIDDDNREPAALSLQWLGRFIEGGIRDGELSPALTGEARTAFELAAKHFDVLESHYSSKARWDTVKAVGVVVAMAVLSGAATAANQAVANQQAHQMAQYDSVRSLAHGGSGYGTGIAYYSTVTFTPGDTVWTAARSNSARASAAKVLAEKCREKAECYLKKAGYDDTCCAIPLTGANN